MKKRHLKQWVKDFIACSILFSICLASIIGMCYRAEQIDNKKELSNPTQIEIR